ncbi:SusC/RagA family TonB-linked outer membrane protein [Bacteroides thetaiotaomicron]|uniref:SusC/RagA family TonB-linked outer membrane protein n=1 Tax=Bacteroides thetaiotaomicron TaxID=818 RepID=UPI00286D8F21|nr:SusC/RagA family TonB-linked outer membrane protein [Bacteroides thetaiotaomicron]MCS3006588.1 SusC/RagA family TonB-linked outer membrane protein [Bacteroides thetaiotaomicron]
MEATGSYYSATSYLTTRSKEFAAYLYKEDGSYQQVGEDKDQGNSGNKDQRYRITFLKGAVGYDHSFGKHKVAALFVADLNQIQDQNVQKGYLRNYTNYSGRMNYNYDDRYLAEAVYTRGGYNWLAPGNRWADYWGVGAAWNGHNESFVKEFNIFSTLKPRISYAVTGQAICDYAEYKQSYGTSKVHLYGGPFDNKWTEENKTASRLNPEIAKKLNVGIDLGFLNDRLAFTFDYYQNRFSDVVATSEIKTAILGNVYPRSNCEKYSYTGTEMVLTWQDRIRNFNYFINGNLSFEQSKFEYSPQLPKAYPWMSRLGDPVGMTYGYVADGIFQSQEEIDAYDAFLPSAVKSTIMPGDIRYKDLNGDHIIDMHDQTNLGSKKAKGYYGISAGFNYRGFDFSVFAQGTLNRQVYLNGDFMDGSGKNGEGAITSYVLGRWTPDNHTNTHTRVWYGSNNNNRQTSSFWIYDADFFRLKNVEIGYTLPTLLTRKLGIPSVRIYAQGMNLLTVSEIFDVRKDIDPEIWGGSFPMTRTINFGISIKL